jgi:hypothetical protein
MEEKVLHAMSGTVLVDERTNQLHRIEGKIPADVNLGYGLLGTVQPPAASARSTRWSRVASGKKLWQIRRLKVRRAF